MTPDADVRCSGCQTATKCGLPKNILLSLWYLHKTPIFASYSPLSTDGHLRCQNDAASSLLPAWWKWLLFWIIRRLTMACGHHFLQEVEETEVGRMLFNFFVLHLIPYLSIWCLVYDWNISINLLFSIKQLPTGQEFIREREKKIPPIELDSDNNLSSDSVLFPETAKKNRRKLPNALLNWNSVSSSFRECCYINVSTTNLCLKWSNFSGLLFLFCKLRFLFVLPDLHQVGYTQYDYVALGPVNCLLPMLYPSHHKSSWKIVS